MKLSVVVSVYNEEKNIEKCLESVKNIADEIIVVDNSSTDKTAFIARKFTKKIYTQENDRSKIDLQKNFGFTKATGDWILSLDADERVTGELAKEIKSMLSGEVQGFWISRKNFIFGKWIKSDMWWPDYQLRLFRRGKGRFVDSSVHKSLRVDGKTEKLLNPMIHENYISVFQYVEKLNNYTEAEADKLIREDYRLNLLDSIRFPVDDFVKTFFLQKGYKDGLHGLVLSILQAFYMEVVFAKIWEKNGFEEKEQEGFLKNVAAELKESGKKIKYWYTTQLIDRSKNPLSKILLKTSRKMSSPKSSK